MVTTSFSKDRISLVRRSEGGKKLVANLRYIIFLFVLEVVFTWQSKGTVDCALEGTKTFISKDGLFRPG